MASNPKYGVEHRAVREVWARRIAMGGVVCWRCKGPIAPGAPWHLGHDDRGLVHVGPEHPGCNVRAANALRADDARKWRAALESPVREDGTREGHQTWQW